MQSLKGVDEVVARALQEDVGPGDLTAALIPERLRSTAQVLTREDAVLCGVHWFSAVFRQLDPRLTIAWQSHDGDEICRDQVLCQVSGPTRALLTGERTALNFLQTLSGTATVAREYARALAGTRAKLLDTRKTVPGLREAQKYAVRCGGGHNHRMGLFDGVLIKENHIAAAGSITRAVSAAKSLYPEMRIEVEVEDPPGLDEAIAAGADTVLLDNFSLEGLKAAVARNRGRGRLEVSGGVELTTLRSVAETGVDYISVGALTKHLRAIDMSMRFIAPTP